MLGSHVERLHTLREEKVRENVRLLEERGKAEQFIVQVNVALLRNEGAIAQLDVLLGEVAEGTGEEGGEGES